MNRNTKIILGGPQVTHIAKTLLEKNGQIDIIVRGEGEITFIELVKSLLNSNKNINGICGITYRLNGKIVDNADRKIILDLDSIPSPYISNFISLQNRVVSLEIQRGCIFKCHFCYYPKAWDRIRYFSMKRLKKELAFLLKQRFKTVYLMASVFNLNKNRAKRICNFIAENNINNVEFQTEIKAELLDEELAELFHKANIIFVEIGLQSTNDKVLRLVNRKLDIAKFVNGVNLIKKYGVYAEIQLILGLPGDTFHSFKRSLEFALNLNVKGGVYIYRLQVLPGTRIWSQAKELGIIFEEEPPHRFLQSKTFPSDELVKLLNISDKLVKLPNIQDSLPFFRSKKTIKFLCVEAKVGLVEIIEMWIKWLNDNNILLISQNSNVFKDKLRGFLKYFCKKNRIDPNFYNILLEKEIKHSR